MRVPKKLLLAGKVIRLTYPASILDPDDGRTSIFALTTNSDLTIAVSRSRPTSEAAVWETILHELVHCALDVSGVNNLLDAKVEEAVAHSLELLAPLLAFRPSLRGVTWAEVVFDFEED